MLLFDWFKKWNAPCPASEDRLKILAVSLFVTDRLVLARLGELHGCELRFTDSPRAAFSLIAQKHFDLILCNRNQPGYPWREVVSRLADGSPRSRILLVSPVSDEYLWRDLVQYGGYDVLPCPVREHDLLQLMNAEEHVLSHVPGRSL